MNKDDNDAVSFDYPNNKAPGGYNHIYYGNQLVPRPTNIAAQKIYPDAIMKSVLEGK